jgi:glycosyltransferase involved in cell wall biosynthesis
LTQLTIVIPAYNMHDTIEGAIESVLGQDIPVHVIVVDDASEQPVSLSDAHARDSRIEIIRHSDNRGAAAARNTGARRASTPWLGFLDADDKLLPGTLAARLAFAIEEQAKSGRQSIFGCGWVTPEPDGRLETIRFPKSARTASDMLRGCWYCPGSCILLERSLFLEHLQDEHMPRLEDFDWSIRLGLSGITLTVQLVAGCIIAPSGRVSLAAVEAGVKAIRERHQALIVSHSSMAKDVQAYLEFELGAVALREKAFLKGAVHLLKSIAALPRLRLHPGPGWNYQLFER